MSISSLGSLSNSYLQSVVGAAFQATGLTASKSANNLSGIGALSGTQSDTSKLSPFAQLVSTLQQLQQSDPAKFKQVTQQIATNLQSAAQTAQKDGNTTAATQLNALAKDFTDASSSGQLPNLKDLARAIGGHHHHHAQAAASSSNGDTDSSSTTSSTTANDTLTQLLSLLQANGNQASGNQNDALNPASIILGTLSQATGATS